MLLFVYQSLVCSLPITRDFIHGQLNESVNTSINLYNPENWCSERGWDEVEVDHESNAAGPQSRGTPSKRHVTLPSISCHWRLSASGYAVGILGKRYNCIAPKFSAHKYMKAAKKNFRPIPCSHCIV